MKYLALFVCCFFLIISVSCKKDYTCCYKDSSGVTQGGTYPCVTVKMSKSEKNDTEDAANAVLADCGTPCDGWTFECE